MSFNKLNPRTIGRINQIVNQSLESVSQGQVDINFLGQVFIEQVNQLTKISDLKTFTLQVEKSVAVGLILASVLSQMTNQSEDAYHG